MPLLKKILIFILVNILGFSTGTICFYLGWYTGAVPSTENEQALLLFKEQLFGGTPIVWLICALFSLGYFFMEGKERLAFLWLPFIIPMLYGLYVLYWL